MSGWAQIFIGGHSPPRATPGYVSAFNKNEFIHSQALLFSVFSSISISILSSYQRYIIRNAGISQRFNSTCRKYIKAKPFFRFTLVIVFPISIATFYCYLLTLVLIINNFILIFYVLSPKRHIRTFAKRFL